MDENELSKKIVEASLAVHRKIGPGMLESIYEECLSKEKDIHFLQTYSYIKILNFKLGLLINFNVTLIKMV